MSIFGVLLVQKVCIFFKGVINGIQSKFCKRPLKYFEFVLNTLTTISPVLDCNSGSDARPDAGRIKIKPKQQLNRPKKLRKTATTYITVEGVGLLEGKKPFKNEKKNQLENIDVIVDSGLSFGQKTR